MRRTLPWLTLMVALVPAEALAQQGASADYFSNGAAVTAVPTSGPAASYFTNGAEATTVPTSVMPNYSFSPAFASVASPTGDSGAPVPAATRVEAAVPAATSSAGIGAAAVPASPTETVPPETEALPESTAATLASTPASGSGVTLASEPGSEPTSTPASPSGRAAASGLEPVPAPALGPVPGVTPSAVLWSMLGGGVIAAFLVFLGTRIRATRNPSAGRPRRSPS